MATSCLTNSASSVACRAASWLSITCAARYSSAALGGGFSAATSPKHCCYLFWQRVNPLPLAT